MAARATSSASTPARGTAIRPRGSNCQATAPDAGQLAAGLGEHRADLGRGPVAVVGLGLDEDRHAARAVALVDDLLELLGLAAAGRLVDRPLDVVGRHVDRARLLDGEPQPVVGVGVTAALPGRHADLARDLGEQGAALGVGDALLRA